MLQKAEASPGQMLHPFPVLYPGSKVSSTTAQELIINVFALGIFNLF